MRVESIETRTYRLPLARPWGDQTHRVTEIELVVTRIAAGGHVGTGFSYSVGVAALATQTLLDAYIAPRLLGQEANPRVQWRQLWRHMHDAGGGGLTTMALAATDIALWDLIGKEQQRPLVDILGRFRESIPAYGSGVNLNLDMDRLEEQVRRWHEAGYAAVKVKVGMPDPHDDLDRLAMVRRVIGPRGRLLVDANQGWNLTQAVHAVQSYAPFDVSWVEEPLISDDVDGHARLRQRVSTPIAIGENVYTAYQFNDYMARGACDYVQADVVRVGGITPWLEIADLARTWDLPMAPHFLLEITGQLLCCVENGHILEDVEGGSFRELGILAEEVRVKDGWFTPPERPGHGIVLDQAALDAHQIFPAREAGRE